MRHLALTMDITLPISVIGVYSRIIGVYSRIIGVYGRIIGGGRHNAVIEERELRQVIIKVQRQAVAVILRTALNVHSDARLMHIYIYIYIYIYLINKKNN